MYQVTKYKLNTKDKNCLWFTLIIGMFPSILRGLTSYYGDDCTVHETLLAIYLGEIKKETTV